MKKTILNQVLLATFALTSATAMAATVYTDKGTQVDLYGRFGAYFDKTKDTNTDLKDDKTRLGFKVTHELSQDLTALGGVELRFSDVNKRFSDPVTHDAYAGFKYNPVGTLTFGRQATTADDLALSKYAYQHEDVTLAPTQGDRTIKFRSASFGQEGWGYISAGVDHTFKGSTNKDANIRQASTGAGLFYTNNFGEVGFKLNGGYVYSQNDGTMANTNYAFITDPTTIKQIEKAWLVGTELTYGDFATAFDYSQNLISHKDLEAKQKQDLVRYDALQFAVKYNASKETTLFAAYQYKSAKDRVSGTTQDKSYQYTLGADYKLHKNVVTYAQIDTTKYKSFEGDKKTEVGGAVGLRVLF